MKRNPSIELYRALLMLGICLLHGFSQGAFVYVWPARLLSVCLTAFVFISGWYGIRFSWKKAIGLVLIGWYCRYVGCVAYALLAGMDLPSLNPFNALRATKVYWFLWAYIALMLVAPVLNLAIEYAKAERKLLVFLPVFVLVFGWSYLCGMPTKGVLPNPGGAGGSAFLSFIGIYLAARLFKEFNLDAYVTKRVGIAVACVCCPAAMLGAGHHMNSVFALVLSAVMFVGMKNLGIPERYGKFLSLLSPSLFSVYLLHTHMFGFGFLERIDEVIIGGHAVLACIVSAIMVFVIGLALDFPRRIVMEMSRKAMLFNV